MLNIKNIKSKSRNLTNKKLPKFKNINNAHFHLEKKINFHQFKTISTLSNFNNNRILHSSFSFNKKKLFSTTIKSKNNFFTFALKKINFSLQSKNFSSFSISKSSSLFTLKTRLSPKKISDTPSSIISDPLNNHYLNSYQPLNQIRFTRGPSKNMRDNLIDILSSGTLHTKTIVQNMDDQGWVDIDLIWELYPRIALYTKQCSLEEAISKQTSSNPRKTLEINEKKTKIRLKENNIKDRLDNEIREELGMEVLKTPYPLPILEEMRKVSSLVKAYESKNQSKQED